MIKSCLFFAGKKKRNPSMLDTVVIRCRENGPLLVLGAVKVVDHLGNEFSPPAGKEAIALCRCGHSKNKPFCDGSHRGCHFQASEVASPADRGLADA
jgi:CDGSH-type Zn-finger protein